MTGFELYDNVAMHEFAFLLNRMLDLYPLEPVYNNTDSYEVSKFTMYEKILKRTEIENIKTGILTAAGKAAMNGYDPLRENQVSIDGVVFYYFGEDAFNMLGKSVNVYYKEIA